ncbi:glycosyltransferase family 2 protein [Dysgonomonas reticulitermitis]|nr:glycosyl transferase [Bacteroidia bacterium]
MTKVSILMPVYNAEQYLAQAIDSILNQTFKDWELIIINDGSTDSSETIISRYKDNRIYYYKNPENLKLIKTLNKGIDYCHGKYIARMDADDFSFPERLEYQVEFLDNNHDYVMCGTNAIVIDGNFNKTGKIRNLPDDNLLQVNLLFSPPFIHPSVMIRREVLQKNRYDEDYKHVEDYELWCRVARQGKVANLQKDLLAYRWHDTNVSVLNNQLQEEMKDRIIREQLKRLDIEPTDEELYCHKITFRLYALGRKQDISVQQSEAVSAWFEKLLRQNKKIKRYDRDDFKAFLWARWAVLCISQKRYSKIFSPAFASYHPDVLSQLFELFFFLKNK